MSKVRFLADSSDIDAGHRLRQDRATFKAGVDVTEKEWAMLSVSSDGYAADGEELLYVVPALGGSTGTGLTVGVFAHSASADELVEVIISGYVKDAVVGTSVAEGDSLVVADTSGTARTLAATDVTMPCGVALEDDTTGVADVIVCNPLNI